MDTINTYVSSSASVFEACSKDPALAVAYAMDELEIYLARYLASSDPLDATELLTEIEALRRFVLVRPALLNGLRQPRRNKSRSMGSQLCEVLQAMIGDVPSLVAACTTQGARTMERDTRRAIASLMFLGSLDLAFL